MVDVLDDTIDMWHYGKHMFKALQYHNTYIPVRHTIMPKPNLVDNPGDDMQWRYGRNTYDGLNINPIETWNPLRTYGQSGPKKKEVQGQVVKVNRKFSRWRRLAHHKHQPLGLKGKAFSTTVEQGNEEPRNWF